MKFKDKLQAAGFKTKAQFARHVDMTPTAVSNWKECPPKWVHRLLDHRIANLKALEV